MAPEGPSPTSWAQQSSRNLAMAASATRELTRSGDVSQGAQRWQETYATLVVGLNGDEGMDRLNQLIWWMSIELASASSELAAQQGITLHEYLRRRHETHRMIGALDPETQRRLMGQ
jgi:hypothetical protein